MNNVVTCPECGKEIGTMILDRVTKVKGLGNIPCYHYKYDYRKTAHIGFGKGLICRKCAKHYFPNGTAYRVTVDYHGKRITPFIGIKQTGLFATAKEAYYAARDMDNSNRSNMAQYEEVKV